MYITMNSLFNPPLFIGISPTTSGNRAIIIEKRQGKIYINSFISNVLDSKNNKESVFRKKTQRKIIIAIALNPNDTLIRSLAIKSGKKNFRFAISQIEEQNLSSPLSKWMRVKQIKHDKTLKTAATLFATPLDELKKTVEIYRDNKIDPDYLFPLPIAVEKFSTSINPLKTPLTFLYIGKTKSTLIAVGKTYTLSRCIDMGEDLLKKTDNTLEQKQITLFNHQLMQSYLSLKSPTSEHIEEKIILLGPLVGQTNLNKQLSLQFNFSQLTPSPLFPNISPITLQEYAVEIGLSLLALKGGARLNHRKGLIKKRNRIRDNLSIILSVTTVSLTTLLILFAAMLAIDLHTQKDIATSMKNLIKQANIPFTQENKETLSIQQAKDNLLDIKRHFNSRQIPFPLLPPIPLAVDVIASLENLREISIENTSEPPITIDSFLYRVIAMPSWKNPKEPFQAKVDITFSTPSPKTARKFLQLLSGKESNLSPSPQVNWSFKNQQYNVSLLFTSRPQNAKSH